MTTKDDIMKYYIIPALLLLSACGVDEQDDPKQWDTNETQQMGDQNNAQEPKTESVEQTPKVEQPTQPKPTDPKKEDPILEPSKREFVKVYRHQDYACAIDTNNTALCDKAPPKGPTSPELLIPLELENVEQMALADHGYCVLTTFKHVNCYGYERPFANGRAHFNTIQMSADGRLWTVGGVVEPRAEISSYQFSPYDPMKVLFEWREPYGDRTQWANINLSQTTLNNTHIVCGLDLNGRGHCFDGTTEKAVPVAGSFKQLVPHNQYSLCALSPRGQWSCWNKTSPDDKFVFDGVYKRLFSSVCALTKDDRVRCWQGKIDGLSSPPKLVDPVGIPVKDFSHTPLHFFAHDSKSNNHINNWCAIDMEGKQTCAPYENTEVNGPSL